jgi:acyl-CoA reductase-like NAD-dependent aldehyde dehydrogenase
LGGKDPAYVRPDCDIAYAAENLVDGAMYNSGQSCCAIERIYVHESIYTQFVDEAVKVVKGYKLGDPMDAGTNLGPVVRVEAAEAIRKQVDDAVSKGAKLMVDSSLFPEAKVRNNGRYTISRATT